MSVRQVVIWPSPLLRRECKEFTEGEMNDAEFVTELYQSLVDTMCAFGGVGIAAPQIGISRRMFIVDKSAEKVELNKKITLRDEIIAFINPRIVRASEEKATYKEGCLSFPTVYVDVKRPREVEVATDIIDWTTETPKVVKDVSFVARGFLATIIQHEYDHIEGKLLADYMSPLKKRVAKQKIKLWRQMFGRR